MVLNKLVDMVPVGWADALVEHGVKNPQRLRRILCKLHPEMLARVGENKALHGFHRAAERVPSYKKFLKQNNIDPRLIHSMHAFDHILPPIDKDSYIKTATSLKELCVDQNLEDAEMLVRSSGFSGKPVTWARSRKEEAMAKHFATIGLSSLFHIHQFKTLFINAFALGSWVSGVDLLKVTDEQTTTINPGLEQDEVINIVQEVAPQFEQIIIASNPPFLKNVIEKGKEEGVNWKKMRVNLLSGGEPITEEWRDYLYSQIGANHNSKGNGFIYSGFGASDIGIIGVYETADAVDIKKRAGKNQLLHKALFGGANSLPMLFQYDPTTFHITTNQQGELHFTTSSSYAMTPLIKYNLHDIGGVIPHKTIKDILKKFDIVGKIELPFPFVYVLGRTGGEVSYYGSLIYPENIKQAILSHKDLLKSASEEFRMKVIHDKKQNESLHIDVKLKKDHKPSMQLHKLYENHIEKSLQKTNQDFRQDYATIKENRGKQKIISIKLHKAENYPHTSGIKIRYV